MALELDGKKIEGTVYINLCNGASIIGPCKNDFSSSAAYFAPNGGGPCINMISRSFADNAFELLEDTDPSLIKAGFSIRSKSRDVFEVILRCKERAKSPVFNPIKNGVEIQSADACGVINEPAKLLQSHRYVLSGIIVFIGLILLAVGGYKWDMLIGAFGFIAGAGLIFFLFWNYVDFAKEASSYIAIAAVSLVVGVLLAYICHENVRISYAFLGLVVGFLLADYLILALQLVLEQVC